MKKGKTTAGLLAGLMLLGGCASPTPTPTPVPTPTPEVAPALINYYTLTDEKHPYPYVGIGAQYNNGLYNELSQWLQGYTEANYPQAEELIKAMGCQHIRIFYDSMPWRVQGGEDNPNNYSADTADRASFRKVVELAQNTPNATVNITFWHGPYPMSALNIEGNTDIKVPFLCDYLEEFAEELYYLIETRDFTSVKYVTIQNEVDTTEMTLQAYEKVYRSLDYYLRQKGIRDKIEFVGGDLASTSVEKRREWLSYMGTEMGDLIEGYSIHQYWHFDDENVSWNNLDSRLSNLSILMHYMTAEMPEEQRRPVYITEFGTKGYDGEDNISAYPKFVSAPNDPDAVPIMWLTKPAWQTAYYMIDALNYGAVGLCKWDAYRAQYSGPGLADQSSLGGGNDNFALRPPYYLQTLIAAAAVPGSDILKVKATPAFNYNKLAVLRAPNGDLTLMMSQDTDRARTMVVDALEPGQEFHLYYWNENGDGKNTYKGKITVDKWGRLSVVLGVETMAVVTSAELSGVIIP